MKAKEKVGTVLMVTTLGLGAGVGYRDYGWLGLILAPVIILSLVLLVAWAKHKVCGGKE